MAARKRARKSRARKAATTRRSAAPRRRVSRKRARPKPKARLGTALTRVLRDHGITLQLIEVHLKPAPVSPTALAGVTCGPNEVRRVVCTRRPDGTLVCREKCVAV